VGIEAFTLRSVERWSFEAVETTRSSETCDRGNGDGARSNSRPDSDTVVEKKQTKRHLGPLFPWSRHPTPRSAKDRGRGITEGCSDSFEVCNPSLRKPYNLPSCGWRRLEASKRYCSETGLLPIGRRERFDFPLNTFKTLSPV
jgi:hypothetical protein